MGWRLNNTSCPVAILAQAEPKVYRGIKSLDMEPGSAPTFWQFLDSVREILPTFTLTELLDVALVVFEEFLRRNRLGLLRGVPARGNHPPDTRPPPRDRRHTPY